MDKHVKLLVESLFDDFDDIYNADEDIEAKIQQLYKIKSLAECTTIDEINTYLFDKINDDIAKENGQSLEQWLSSINPYNCNEIKYFNFGEKIRLSCTQDKSPEIMYRGKMTTFPNTVWIEVFSVYIRKDKIVWEVGTKDVSSQAKKVIDTFNKENNEVRYTNIINEILNVIQISYKTERLYEELTCTGKVYKVVDKDIQRMTKCLSTGNYDGFDAIKKPDKMVD